MASPQNQTKLWIGIPAQGMPFKISEVNIMDCVVQSANRQLLSIGQEKITPENIVSVQKIQFQEAVWIIQCDSQDVKQKILSIESITIQGKQYPLQDMNTQRVKSASKQAGTRISIHGIPTTVDDGEIEQFVDSWAERSSKIMRARAKLPMELNSTGTKTTHLLNGHRYCYAREINTPADRYSLYECANPLNPQELIKVVVTIYHENQSVNCRKCFEAHETRECPLNKSKIQNENLVLFRGIHNALSNWYPTQITIEEQTFDSSEQLYQYMKARYMKQPELQQKILKAKTAKEAMELGHSIDTSKTNWLEDQVEVMKFVAKAKYDCCEQFKESLSKTGDKIIVEATKNLYWGSGLTPIETAEKPMQEWPGKNVMGFILVELRTKERNKSMKIGKELKESDNASSPTQKVEDEDDGTAKSKAEDQSFLETLHESEPNTSPEGKKSPKDNLQKTTTGKTRNLLQRLRITPRKTKRKLSTSPNSINQDSKKKSLPDGDGSNQSDMIETINTETEKITEDDMKKLLFMNS